MKKNEKLFLDLSSIIEKKEIDILIFDIFDTIILRKVHPEYVKKIFSKKLKEHYNLNISSEELYRYRFDSEAALCKTNEKKGFDLEFNFYGFCRELFDELQNKGVLNSDKVFDNFYTHCQKFEIDSELATQQIDWNIIELVKKAKQREIPIYCLSDFYLPKEMLETLFKKHNIYQYFSDIIVSSEHLITKRSGKLYEKILEEQFANKKIVMVGDNKHSDYKMAKKHNLEAYLVDREDQRNFYQAHEKEATSQKVFHKQILNIINQDYSSENNTYFKEMSFTLYYFIYKLYLEAVSNDIQHIFFLSREGEFLKKLFDKFLEVNLIDNIQTHYLIVSRKSTFIASLGELHSESFKTLFRQYRKMSLNVFLKSLNFSDAEISKISLKKKWNFNRVEKDLPTSSLFKEFLNDKDFQVLYKEKRNTQKKNLQKYIKSFGVDIESEGVTLIDAGWKGTIQDHIYKVFDEKIVINGFYIGLVADLMPDVNNIKKGLVFDFKNIDRLDKVYQENLTLFEVLLGASHGSADYYDMNEYNIVKSITYQKVEEQEIFEQVIRPIQEVLFKVFKNISNEFALSHVSILDIHYEVTQVHARMIYSPTHEEVGFFRKLYHFENFGVFEFSTFNKYKTESKKDQIKHILKFIKNPRKFFDSTFWKAAALDDIGLFRVYLLYGIYQKIKIFRGKK